MRTIIFTFLAVIFLISCDKENTEQVAKTDLISVTQLSDSTFQMDNSQIGEATFKDFGDRVQVKIKVSGLIPNWSHAVHLHMGSCEQPGHHWNQMTQDNFCETQVMGEPWLRPKAGDVGNINTDTNGDGTLVVESDLWGLNSGDMRDITGMVLIIHEGPEDFITECAQQHIHMHNNRKIACGSVDLVLND